MSQNLFFHEHKEEKLNKVFKTINTVHLKDNEYSDYLEDKASLYVRMRVEAHVAQCNLCRDELQMLKDIHQEGPGKLDTETADQIKKLLAYIPTHASTSMSKPAKNQPSIFDIGRLGFHLAALSTQGKIASDWAELSLSEDKQCAWTYREDDQRNLIFKFTVFSPEPKVIQLKAAGQTWETLLKPEGDQWIAEVIISAQERANLQSGDDIQIQVINK